jgi:hypothetical protein
MPEGVTVFRSIIAIALLVHMLVACAPLFPVQIAPLGGERYVATQASESSWLDARTSAIKRAAAWCSKRGGEFGVLDSEQQRTDIFLPGVSKDHATVQFQCAGMTR